MPVSSCAVYRARQSVGGPGPPLKPAALGSQAMSPAALAVHDLGYRLDHGARRRAAGLPRVLEPGDEGTECVEFHWPPGSGAGGVVAGFVGLRADLVEDKLDPAAAVLRGARDGCFHARKGE